MELSNPSGLAAADCTRFSFQQHSDALLTSVAPAVAGASAPAQREKQVTALVGPPSETWSESVSQSAAQCSVM